MTITPNDPKSPASADLPARTLQRGAVATGFHVGNHLLRVVTLATLARLLAPADFGLVGMVLAFMNVAPLLQDFGLSLATIQREELTRVQVSALFWMNVAISTTLAASFVLLAPLLSLVYGDPRLTDITRALAIGVFVYGCGVQHRALMTRDMRFGPIGIAEGVAQGVGMALGIGAALLGLGVWSLVVMHLSQTIVNTTGMWIACRWRPGRPRVVPGVRELVTFGRHMTAFQLTTYISRNVDDILVGTLFGATALGLYSKAYQLLRLPIALIREPISRVTISTLSRLQSDAPRFRTYYRNALQVVALLGMPVIVFLTLDVELVVRLVLGEQWDGAVRLFQAFALAAFLNTIQVTGSWACVPLGRAARLARWQLWATAIMVAGFMVGAFWGALGIAVSVSVTTVLLRVPSWVYLFRGTPIRIVDVLRSVARPAVCSMAAALGVVLARWVITIEGDAVLRLGPDLVGYTAAYLLCWIVAPGGVEFLRGAVKLLRRATMGPGDSTLAWSFPESDANLFEYSRDAKDA